MATYSKSVVKRRLEEIDRILSNPRIDKSTRDFNVKNLDKWEYIYKLLGDKEEVTIPSSVIEQLDKNLPR